MRFHCTDLLTRPKAPGNSLTQFTIGTTILASNTIQNHDRIALGYVDGAATNQFQLLLPLGFHSVDDIRAALNIFARRTPFDKQDPPDLGVAIQEVSRVFSSSPRIAYCHLFFVSSMLPANYSVPWIDQAIGFHTITPQSFVPLTHLNKQPGWHIFYDFGTEETHKKRTHFTRNVQIVIRHIRVGLRPGYLTQVKIDLTPGSGCQIEPVNKTYQIASLRPGETWTLPVRVIVPVAFQEPDRNELQKLPPIAMETIIGINKFLMGWVRDIPERILTVNVEYRHSLLPTECTINLPEHVTSLRCRHAHHHPQPDFSRPSTMSVQPGERFILRTA